MTVSTTNTHIPAARRQSGARAAGQWIRAIFEMIAKHREARRFNRTRPFYYNDKAELQERAQRDAHWLWMHHF